MNSDDSLLSTNDDSLEWGAPHREWPLISVIIATYQRAHLLPRALDSVLAQTFRDMEVIVVHDGPADPDTLKVCEEYDAKFEAIGVDFYVAATDEHTGYYCYSRNTATENSRGTYIANLDDDNEWLPTTLADLVEAMEEGEAWPDLVYGRRRYVLDEGAPTEHNGRPLLPGDSPFVPWDEMAKNRLAIGPQFNFIDSSDFLVSKGVLYRMGTLMGRIWDENKRRFGDFWLVSTLAWFTDCKFKALDKIVQIYHVHPGCVSLNRDAMERAREVNVNE